MKCEINPNEGESSTSQGTQDKRRSGCYDVESMTLRENNARGGKKKQQIQARLPSSPPSPLKTEEEEGEEKKKKEKRKR
ncbi:hypothetical protein Tco_1262026 [Tanacetum coccineum]